MMRYVPDVARPSIGRIVYVHTKVARKYSTVWTAIGNLSSNVKFVENT